MLNNIMHRAQEKVAFKIKELVRDYYGIEGSAEIISLNYVSE